MHTKFFDKEHCFKTYSTFTLLLNYFCCRNPTLETMVHCMEMIQLEYKFSDKIFVSADKYFSLYTIALFLAIKILSWQVLWCYVPRWNRKDSFLEKNKRKLWLTVYCVSGVEKLYRYLWFQCVCDLVNWTKWSLLGVITCHGQNRQPAQEVRFSVSFSFLISKSLSHSWNLWALPFFLNSYLGIIPLLTSNFVLCNQPI